jgi:hypothetical protein
MTALTEYQRLEATGTWRNTPDAQRQNVVVSIGNATLVIVDASDLALAHWSLAAVERVNPGVLPAIYKPGPDAVEDLEVADEEMVNAVERVRRSVERGRPKPGSLRMRLTIVTVALLLAAVVIWLPDALLRYTASIVPDAKREAIGAALVSHIKRVSGQPCETPIGSASLLSLGKKLDLANADKILVLPSGVRETAHLPGDYILLNRSVVEDYETSFVPAGFILAETQRASARDPLLHVLKTAGLRPSMTLMTTGNLPDDALGAYAEHMLTQPSEAVDQSKLLGLFTKAQVPASPFAYAIDITGEKTAALIAGDPVAKGEERPLLSDGEWVALQGICLD